MADAGQMIDPMTVGNDPNLTQPGYLGAPATVNPTTVQAPQAPAAALAGSPNAQAAGIDLSQLRQGWMTPQGPQAVNNVAGLDQNFLNTLGANPTIAALIQGFQPQANSATNNLNQTLANFGVTGGPAVAAMTQLQSQLGAALAPSIASAIQNSQANTLQGNEFNVNTGLANAGNQLTQNDLAAQLQASNAGQFNSGLLSALGQNAGFQQQANLSNAGNALTAALANQGAVNQGNQFNASLGMQGALANQNAGNAASQYNANALNATNAANVGAFNQAQEQQLADLINAWALQSGAFNNINATGQGGLTQQGLNYGQDITQSDPFGQIFGGLAGLGGSLATGGFFNPAKRAGGGTLLSGGDNSGLV